MKRKYVVVGIILLLVGTCSILAVAQNNEGSQPTSRGTWLYVGGSGPGNYTTIQGAIDDASPGDTVYVYDDMSPYSEFILIHKSIHLIGEDKNTTIIMGIDDGLAGVIQISGTFCSRIQSFTIINAKRLDSGIYCFSNFYLTVTDVNIKANGTGINLDSGSHNTIACCTVQSIADTGSGIAIYFSSKNTIINCNLINNRHNGIFLQESSNNKIFHNNFINNTRNAFLYECSDNFWDNRYPCGGNYWDDYVGNDTNGDGIGDTPYNISDNNRDLYPFMEPNGWVNATPDFQRAVIYGRTTNLSSQGGYITFEALKIRIITFNPFRFTTYRSQELFIITRDYFGFIETNRIIALCKILP